jgi:hypothetical protein
VDIKELKILLKLLGKPDHRSPVGQVKPNEKTSASETRGLCRQLINRTYIESREEIITIKITPAGKELLKLAKEQTPLTAQELKLLQTVAKGSVKPSQVKVTPKNTPAAKRDELIKKAIDRGFLEIAQKEIREVWLTEAGKKFLAQEYLPSGAGNFTLSPKMVGDYIIFIRKYYTKKTDFQPSEICADEEILATIKNLNYELETDNFLPIFHLREKLKLQLSRKKLDEALFRLQRQNKIEISSLVKAEDYTPEQVRAGIAQTVGGPLFFIIVN